MMQKRIDNEEAVAFGWIWIIISIGFFALLYICFSPVVNEFVTITNDYSTAGTISEQTQEGVETGVNIFRWIPVIGILGALLFAYLYAVNEKRKAGEY